ncbi:MAG: prepilin-type N-terminal cleavage/methylation domain-containing protein [Bacilli bacterium]|nr:prepilin-type N-terminal cleavage/methylation domain-containing protein [Bacilli bacterium]
MKNNKKGFTLIELLAVIVILSIVALISVPMILGVIEKAKIGSAESGALGYLDGFEKQMITNLANGKDEFTDGTYSVDEKDTKTFVSKNNISLKGTKPSKGKVVVENGNITHAELCVTGYAITYNGSKANYDKNANYCSDDTIYEDSNSTTALVGTPILEKAKALVYENDACKTDGSTYNYMDGCYIKGNPTNNYVWYNGFMWRIMGINSDSTVRLIVDENVTAIPYGASGSGLNYVTNKGYINDWLNDYFYSNLKASLTSIIQSGNYFCSEVTADSASARTTCASGSELSPKNGIGIISLDEYNLAATSSSYLNIAQNQWTMTPYSASSAWRVNTIGGASNNGVTNTFGVRPIINVKSSSIITEGDGTASSKYVLAEDKTSVNGTIGDNATSGEYVNLEGKTYRVVSKENDGIKLILDGYYEETIGTAYKMVYGTDNTFITTSGIGAKLNGDILNYLGLTSSEKLVSTSWYQSDGIDYGFKYTDALKESNSITSTKVGLIRIGEMLSSQSSTILTKNYTVTSTYLNATIYWSMNKYTSASDVWFVNNDGNANNNGVTITYGVRPVIKVKKDLTINSGNGTWNSPYKI